MLVVLGPIVSWTHRSITSQSPVKGSGSTQ